MKNILIITIIISGLFLSGCNDFLEEEPPFLSNSNVYADADNATAALDGIYTGMVEFNGFGNAYYFVNGLYSGMMVTRRAGQNPNNPFNSTLATLVTSSGGLNNNNLWLQFYIIIGRANDAIASAITTENPVTNDELVINDVVGQAYFLRAYHYYLFVSLWGDIPLRLQPTRLDDINLEISPAKDVYAQIIEDCRMAESLMNGSTGAHYPASFAANMLLAKVYMNLATAESSVQPDDGITNYWQAAYDEAIKVSGQYALVEDYASLWVEGTSDGTSESIFELQSSETASQDWVRAFTPAPWYISVATFGWLQVNADVYDTHASTYPGDPRIDATYLSTWTQTNNGTVANRYPVNATRANFNVAHPFFFKFAEKNTDKTTRVGNQNIVLFRYADLLLMLAEISNELQNGEQLGYVTEVLDRVNLTPQAGYSGTQDDFRNAIMFEYRFELLGEGYDAINVRRRGFDWMKVNLIDPHNTSSIFNPAVDVTFVDDESLVMRIPIPDNEVNANQKID